MSVFTTYTENAIIQYRSNWCSRATVFNSLIVLSSVIVPFLIAYRMQGFWTKLETVREQPKVQFKHEALIILDTISVDGVYGNLWWTTFSGLQSMLETVTPLIRSREGDQNMDGIKDFLDLDVYFPLKDIENIVGANVILLFEYQLTSHANLIMESMVFLNHLSVRHGNHYEVTGDLGLVQKQPLWNRIRDTRYNTEVIPRNSSSLKDYDLAKIIREYSSRNISTTIKNAYSIWRNDADIEQEFLLRIRVAYTEESYECWAGFWTTIKWAWIQYFAVFIAVFPFLRMFQGVVYKSRIFESILNVPWINKST